MRRRSRSLLIALGVMTLLLPIGCSERNDSDPTSTPRPSATVVTPGPSATATAPAATATSPAVEIRTLTVLAPALPPARSQMFIITGCEACDGPDETLQLHETDAAGATTVTTVMGPRARSPQWHDDRPVRCGGRWDSPRGGSVRG